MTEELKKFYFGLFLYILEAIFANCENFNNMKSMEAKRGKKYDKIIYMAVRLLDIIVNEKILFIRGSGKIKQNKLGEILNCDKGEIKKLFTNFLYSKITYNESIYSLEDKEMKIEVRKIKEAIDIYKIKRPKDGGTFSNEFLKETQNQIEFLIDSHYDIIFYAILKWKKIYSDYLIGYFSRLCSKILIMHDVIPILCKYDKEIKQYNNYVYFNTIFDNKTFYFQGSESIFTLLFTKIRRTLNEQEKHYPYNVARFKTVQLLYGKFFNKFLECFTGVFSNYDKKEHLLKIKEVEEKYKKKKSTYFTDSEIGFKP